MSLDKLAYTKTEAAAACSCGIRHIRQAMASGALPSKRIGIKTVLLKSDLEKWLASRPAQHKRKRKDVTHD